MKIIYHKIGGKTRENRKSPVQNAYTFKKRQWKDNETLPVSLLFAGEIAASDDVEVLLWNIITYNLYKVTWKNNALIQSLFLCCVMSEKIRSTLRQNNCLPNGSPSIWCRFPVKDSCFFHSVLMLVCSKKFSAGSCMQNIRWWCCCFLLLFNVGMRHPPLKGPNMSAAPKKTASRMHRVDCW